MHYTLLCAVARDEVPAVRHWVLYHTAVGFEHILIYDNGNTPPLAEVLREECGSGLVTVIDFPYREAPQLSAYMHCLRTRRDKARWIAFLDLDEYLVPLGHTDVREFLDEYREYAAVCVNWRVFGSDGHIVRPDLPVPRAYTHVLHDDPHIKSIVDPNRTRRPLSPHHFLYEDGGFCVNEDCFPVPGARSYPTFKRIQLNHYYYRSQQDYAAKIGRGTATPVKGVSGYTWDPFYAQAGREGTEDRAIARFCDLCDVLARLPVGARAARLLEEARLSPDAAMCRMTDLIARQEFAAATRLFTHLRRRHRNPLLLCLGARLARWRGDAAEAHTLLREAALCPDISPSDLGQVYTALADLYAHTGDVATAQAVAAFGRRIEAGSAGAAS